MTGDLTRSTVAGLAAALLATSTLTVITIARYESLRDETVRACDTAAALDLSAFVRLCHDAGYQQIVRLAAPLRPVMAEDLDR